jgi:hypothetical protein
MTSDRPTVCPDAAEAGREIVGEPRSRSIVVKVFLSAIACWRSARADA